jgi:flagellar basal-body rod modification protein FlgD
MTTTATPTATVPSPLSTPPAAPKEINTNFTMFLKLLTTQLKNQDPSKPTDPSELAVQLATFSAVEQQTQTNALLKGIGGQVSQMGMSQLAGWVGMEARAQAPAVYVGKPLTLWPKPSEDADKTVLLVTGADGTLAAKLTVPVSNGPITWDGRDATGNALPAGTYSFALQSYEKDKLIATSPVETYSRVVEAQTGADGPLLVLAGGATVAASTVTAIRAAD